MKCITNVIHFSRCLLYWAISNGPLKYNSLYSAAKITEGLPEEHVLIQLFRELESILFLPILALCLCLLVEMILVSRILNEAENFLDCLFIQGYIPQLIHPDKNDVELPCHMILYLGSCQF